MRIEILFPEVCNLYGDSGNVMLLENTLKKASIIKTTLLDEPYFVKNDVDFIYMGPATPNNQKKVLEKLMPYKERLKELINKGVVFLFTGNALEIMGKSINGDAALDIFDYESFIDEGSRYTSLFIGKYKGLKNEIVGYKAQSSNSNISSNYLFNCIKEKNIKDEGIHINNFYGTNLLGPILVLNPYFTKKLLSLIGYNGNLYIEDELITAYKIRLKEFKNENTKY